MSRVPGYYSIVNVALDQLASIVEMSEVLMAPQQLDAFCITKTVVILLEDYILERLCRSLDIHRTRSFHGEKWLIHSL